MCILSVFSVSDCIQEMTNGLYCICYSSDSIAKLGLGSLVVPGVSELPCSVLVPDTTPK